MRRNEGGFTLIEILVVLAVLGIMAAVVVPNMTGFLGRGKDRAYETDRRVLQASVDAYYTDTLARPGTPKYPTGNGSGGSAGTNTYINASHLVSGKYLREAPQSAGSNNGASGSGSYSWYVDADGLVQSAPAYASGVYP